MPGRSRLCEWSRPHRPAGREARSSGLMVLVSLGLDFTGRGLFWYQRPLARLREVVPGRIYISAMPTYRGLKLAQERYHFRTIINLYPEYTPEQSPHWPDELRFARENGLKYLGNPPATAAAARISSPGRSSSPITRIHGRSWFTVTPAWIVRRRGWASTVSWSRDGPWPMPCARSSGTAASDPRPPSPSCTPTSFRCWPPSGVRRTRHLPS